MKYFSVCSGIEAATVAWSPLGWECEGLCDFASFPQKVLSHHYPNTPLFSDLTKLNDYAVYKTINFDLLVGGTPCQSFSDAGLNKGMDDIRGQLSLKYGEILKEKRPRWFIWENVEGVFKGKHRKALCEIISSFTGTNFKAEDLDKQGVVQGEEYSIAYRVFDSQYFGVPQRRKRIFIVGYRGNNWKIPFSVLFEEGCFESVEEKNRIKRDEYTQNILGHIKLAGTVTKSYAQTLVDGFGKMSTSNYWIDKKSIRVFTERELERLQGFPDGYLDFEVAGKKPSYSSVKGAIGNSMTVNVMYWIGQRINFIDNYIESQKVLKSHKK
jgi:DNA (cytosine-5)-methyltransferase 1